MVGRRANLGEIGTKQTNRTKFEAIFWYFITKILQNVAFGYHLWYDSIIFLSKNNDTIHT